MVNLSRRKLLYSGLALSTSSALARSVWAGSTPLTDILQENASSQRDLPGRERLLFDFGWKFTFGNAEDPARDLGFGVDEGDFAKTGDFDFAKAKFDDSKWRVLNLPHDWAVELPFVNDEQQRSHGYKPLGRRYPETSVGWYRREFEIPLSDQGRQITVAFDGAFRDVLVFVNGCFIGRNDNGYAPFAFDLTDFLAYGSKNYIVARVDASFGDGWFYEGAGIYRHIWLTKTDPLHIANWESTARPELTDSGANVNLSTVVINESDQASDARVKWEIHDQDGKTVATAEAVDQTIAPGASASFAAVAHISHPALWSVDAPNLYSATITVLKSGMARDAEEIHFGIRSAVFDADRGFRLNGESLKIQGTCNHQDHAGVGAALPDRLQCFRLGVLKEMGCNAIRTSHNMPTPELVEACDRMGVMMMCETRQMSSNAEGLAQLETMLKRYRNSPSIILWSIGNEEFTLQDDLAEEGGRIAATMVRRCHELDPTRPVSAAVNGTNEKPISASFDVVGFNYNLELPDAFHKKFPKRPLFGSETASAVSTRGEYFTDPLKNVVNAYDTHEHRWEGYETAEDWWQFYGSRAWQAGGFAWTGFDYRGEPSPYSWPSISSQFGIVDTCGFPKDAFYYYKSWWTLMPVLHLFPHWNFEGREGISIPVWVYSNLDEVELLVNGKSQGRQKVPHLGHVEWGVRYEPGEIEARGIRNGNVVLVEKRVTAGPPSSIRITADRAEINADGEDIAVLTIEAFDRQGHPVPTAANSISFHISGDGALIGVGNGDPNCHESDKGTTRSLFHGLAQVIVQSTRTSGKIHIEATMDGLEGPKPPAAEFVVMTKRVQARAVVPAGS